MRVRELEILRLLRGGIVRCCFFGYCTFDLSETARLRRFGSEAVKQMAPVWSSTNCFILDNQTVIVKTIQ
jgi:Zn-finger protein